MQQLVLRIAIHSWLFFDDDWWKKLLLLWMWMWSRSCSSQRIRLYYDCVQWSRRNNDHQKEGQQEGCYRRRCHGCRRLHVVKTSSFVRSVLVDGSLFVSSLWWWFTKLEWVFQKQKHLLLLLLALALDLVGGRQGAYVRDGLASEPGRFLIHYHHSCILVAEGQVFGFEYTVTYWAG